LKKNRNVFVLFMVIAVLLLGAALTQTSLAKRLYFTTLGVFGSDVEYKIATLGNLDSFMRHNDISRAATASKFGKNLQPLPTTFQVDGETHNTQEFLDFTNTVGLIVVKDGNIIHEKYSRGNTAQSRWFTFSTSKQVIGMLVAIAHEDGLINSYDDFVVDYAPKLKGTGWDGVTIRQTLEMTSGIDWEEEEFSLDSDLVETGMVLTFGKSIQEWLTSFEKKIQPGERYEYASINTDALAEVLIQVTGMTISEYLEEKIWKKAGMESDAYWITDAHDRELAFSGLCATLRDYARLGMINLNQGTWNDHKFMSDEWSKKLESPTTKAFSTPGASTYPLMGWYNSFLFSDPKLARGDYWALGSLGQIIYVNRAENMVIAIQSVYPDIENEYDYAYQHLMLTRAIAESFSKNQLSDSEAL